VSPEAEILLHDDAQAVSDAYDRQTAADHRLDAPQITTLPGRLS
jgi:hypothetical protein